jgi:hypothetical protein
MADTPYTWNEAVTLQRRARIHTTYSHDSSRQPIDAVSHAPEEVEVDTDQPEPGTPVEVRTQYLPGQWASGYEIAEVVSTGYRIRCKGSQDTLSEVFRFDDVRLESDPARSGSTAQGSNQQASPVTSAVQSGTPPRKSRSTALLGKVQKTALREAATVVKVVSMSRDAGREATKMVHPRQVVTTPIRSLKSIGHLASPIVERVDPLRNLVRATRGTQDLAEKILLNAASTVGGLGRSRNPQPSRDDLEEYDDDFEDHFL